MLSLLTRGLDESNLPRVKNGLGLKSVKQLFIGQHTHTQKIARTSRPPQLGISVLHTLRR